MPKLSYIGAARLLAGLSLFLAVLAPSQAAAKKGPVHVSSVDVTLKKEMKRGEELSAAVKKALEEEVAYFEPLGKPVAMKVDIQKLSFKSDGKAIVSAIPIVGMFSGPNENAIKAKIQLVDPDSGKVVKKFSLFVNDQTMKQDVEMAKDLGLTALSFIPFAGLIAETAIGVAESASYKKEKAEGTLVKGFARMAYRQVYGGKAYKKAQKLWKAKAKEAPKDEVKPMTKGSEAPVAIPAAEALPAVEPEGAAIPAQDAEPAVAPSTPAPADAAVPEPVLA
jgi:hypothetical protein